MSQSRIVLDTNSLVQCISPRSRYRKIWDSYVQGMYILCVSNEILDEYEEILERLVGEKTAKIILKAIINCPYTYYCDPYYNFKLIENDPDDNKFVDCAVCCGAKCIVTEDRHFNILNEIDFPKVIVVSLDKFLTSL